MIGLEGKDLQDFLRDERAAFRERQFEEKEQAEKEIERQREEQELIREREERDERDKIRQHELEMARLRVEESKNLSSLNETSSSQVHIKSAKLPPFDDANDSIYTQTFINVYTLTFINVFKHLQRVKNILTSLSFGMMTSAQPF